MTGPPVTADELILTTLLLTVEETAHQLRIARTRVFELIKTGALPSVRVGNSRRIRATDLEKYVASLPAEGPAA